MALDVLEPEQTAVDYLGTASPVSMADKAALPSGGAPAAGAGAPIGTGAGTAPAPTPSSSSLPSGGTADGGTLGGAPTVGPGSTTTGTTTTTSRGSLLAQIQKALEALGLGAKAAKNVSGIVSNQPDSQVPITDAGSPENLAREAQGALKFQGTFDDPRFPGVSFPTTTPIEGVNVDFGSPGVGSGFMEPDPNIGATPSGENAASLAPLVLDALRLAGIDLGPLNALSPAIGQLATALVAELGGSVGLLGSAGGVAAPILFVGGEDIGQALTSGNRGNFAPNRQGAAEQLRADLPLYAYETLLTGAPQDVGGFFQYDPATQTVRGGYRDDIPFGDLISLSKRLTPEQREQVRQMAVKNRLGVLHDKLGGSGDPTKASPFPYQDIDPLINQVRRLGGTEGPAVDLPKWYQDFLNNADTEAATAQFRDRISGVLYPPSPEHGYLRMPDGSVIEMPVVARETQEPGQHSQTGGFLRTPFGDLPWNNVDFPGADLQTLYEGKYGQGTFGGYIPPARNSGPGAVAAATGLPFDALPFDQARGVVRDLNGVEHQLQFNTTTPEGIAEVEALTRSLAGLPPVGFQTE